MAINSGIVDGGDILLSANGKTLGCATTHSIEVSADTRNTGSKSTGYWQSLTQSRLSWSGSADFLLNLGNSEDNTTYADLLILQKSRTKIDIKSHYSQDGVEFTQYGKALITSLSQTAPNNDNTVVSLSFLGDGILGTVGDDFFYLEVTAIGAEWVVIDELNVMYNYTLTPPLLIPVPTSSTGYTVSAFGHQMVCTGSEASGAVLSNTSVVIPLSCKYEGDLSNDFNNDFYN